MTPELLSACPLSLECIIEGVSDVLALDLNGNSTLGFVEVSESGGGGFTARGDCVSSSSSSPSSGEEGVGLFAGRPSSGGCSATRLDGVESIAHKGETPVCCRRSSGKWLLM